jgi:hypothetical protein
METQEDTSDAIQILVKRTANMAQITSNSGKYTLIYILFYIRKNISYWDTSIQKYQSAVNKYMHSIIITIIL